MALVPPTLILRLFLAYKTHPLIPRLFASMKPLIIEKKLTEIAGISSFVQNRPPEIIREKSLINALAIPARVVLVVAGLSASFRGWW